MSARQRALGLAALLFLAACAEPPTSVVLVTVDTLRPDHLGAWGYARATSPAIDRLALEGVRFEQAVAPIPETLPSIFSLMTSSWPIEHGVRANGYKHHSGRRALAEVLASAGYDTAAVVGSVVLDAGSGIERGFASFDARCDEPFLHLERGQRLALPTTRAAIDWLEQRSPERPFFLWVHYVDPHAPYAPPAPFDQAFRREPYRGALRGEVDELFRIVRNQLELDAADLQYLVDLHDGEIAYADHAIGELVAAVDRLAPRVLVAFTSDHGEALGEHGYRFDHGEYVWEHQVRVPLILRHPALPAGRTVPAAVSLLDVMPTILELLGIEDEEARSGRSLLPLVRGEEQGERQALLESDTCKEGSVRGCAPLGIRGKLYGLRAGGFKLIRQPDGSAELYDLVGDPAESGGRAGAEPARARQMLAELEARIAGAGAEDQLLDPAMVERLEALGYLD